MAESPESRTERMSVALTPTEKRALEVIATGNPKYDGPSTVVRDFSLVDAVAFVERVRAQVLAVDAAG